MTRLRPLQTLSPLLVAAAAACVIVPLARWQWHGWLFACALLAGGGFAALRGHASGAPAPRTPPAEEAQ